MSETWALVGEGIILLLLFSFVWAVARSSGRGIADQEAAPSAYIAPVGPVAEDRVVPASAAPVAGMVVEPAPPLRSAPPEIIEDPAPVVFTTPEPVADTGTQPALGDEIPPTGEGEPSAPVGDIQHEGALDLGVNIRPRLVVEKSEVLALASELELEGGVTIGRSSSSQLAMDDAFISHMHARIFRRGPFYFIEDLGSTNGTFINGRRVDGQGQLKVHDELRLGETVFRYEE